jgi:hypothetical protein
MAYRKEKPKEIKTMATLPEGYTVRKVGNSLKVVPMRKRRVAIVEERAMDDSFEAQVRRHEEIMAAVYAKRAAEKAEKERQYAEAFANPPALRGSEKQIAWGSKIRAAFIEFYQVRRREYCGDEVLAHTDAKYWIDNRYGMGVTNSDQRAIQALVYAK